MGRKKMDIPTTHRVLIEVRLLQAPRTAHEICEAIAATLKKSAPSSATIYRDILQINRLIPIRRIADGRCKRYQIAKYAGDKGEPIGEGKRHHEPTDL